MVPNFKVICLILERDEKKWSIYSLLAIHPHTPDSLPLALSHSGRRNEKNGEGFVLIVLKG